MTLCWNRPPWPVYTVLQTKSKVSYMADKQRVALDRLERTMWTSLASNFQHSSCLCWAVCCVAKPFCRVLTALPTFKITGLWLRTWMENHPPHTWGQGRTATSLRPAWSRQLSSRPASSLKQNQLSLLDSPLWGKKSVKVRQIWDWTLMLNCSIYIKAFCSSWKS